MEGRGVFRKRAEGAVQKRCQLVRSNVAGDADNEVVTPEAPFHKAAQVIGGDRRHPGFGAFRWTAIGVIGKGSTGPDLASDPFGIGLDHRQAGQNLVADTHRRLKVEAGRVQGQTQQGKGFVAVLSQGLEAALESVQRSVETKGNSKVGQALLKSPGIEVARPFVEQARRHRSQPFLARRVERRAAPEQQGKGNHRDRVILHQPGLDTVRAYHPFDLHAIGRGNGQRPTMLAQAEVEG